MKEVLRNLNMKKRIRQEIEKTQARNEKALDSEAETTAEQIGREERGAGMTYGFCVYHEIECDYKGNCIDCPHNTVEDTEWFRQDEERTESEEVRNCPAKKIQ